MGKKKRQEEADLINRLKLKKYHMKYRPIKNMMEKKTNKKGWKKYQKQLNEKGFSDSDMWSFDITLAEYILPRLIRFRLMVQGYPGALSSHTEADNSSVIEDSSDEVFKNGMDRWCDTIEQMIIAFKIIVDKQDYFMFKDDDKVIVDVGLDLFRKYYFNLWD